MNKGLRSNPETLEAFRYVSKIKWKWSEKTSVTVIFGKQIKMVRKYQLVLLSVGQNTSHAEVNTNMHGKVFQDSELKHGFLLQ